LGAGELLVEEIFSSMSEALMRGENIEIRGFGRFTVRQYRAYDGRNPRTGATVHVRPKRLASSRWAELRARVNNGIGRRRHQLRTSWPSLPKTGRSTDPISEAQY